MISGYSEVSILGRATKSGVLDLIIHDLRLASADLRHSVDDAPFGGGAGMVIMPEPVFKAVETADPDRPLFFLDPGGQKFDHKMASQLAALDAFSDKMHNDLLEDVNKIGLTIELLDAKGGVISD